MKSLWLLAVSVCASGAGLAQVPRPSPSMAAAVQKPHSTRDTCLLGSECLGVSKIPVTACPVTGKNAKVKDACVVDGMKLIGKLTV